MAGRYREKEQEFREEQKKLQEYVNDYIDQYGIRNDVAKLNELADALPGGIVCFRLREIICFLEEKEAQQPCIQGEEACDGHTKPGLSM